MRNSRLRDTSGVCSVLIADSDTDNAAALAHFLGAEGCAVERCHDARGVLRLVKRKSFDVIALDLGLSDEGDVDLVSFIRRQSPLARLVLLFDMAHVERAIHGIRQGAFFYMPKGSRPSDIAMVVGKALRSIETAKAVDEYRQSLFEQIVGSAPAMKRVLEVVGKVAPTDSTVLLLGESGTGKEVLANAVHRLSARREMPFVAVNCAALPENLLESELFGHVKGAFTGAVADKSGLFEEADGGTIFLDEIGDMALVTQAKLLRVLQNGEIRRVGASTPDRVDVRVIAATNQDLEEAVAARAFREDLYYRLNVFQVRVPSLRERMDALPSLVAQFITRFNAKFGKSIRGLDDHAQALLQHYDYPGNVRELESIIAHAVILCDGDVIRAQDLPDQLRDLRGRRLALPDYASESLPSLNEMEKGLIEAALAKLDGNQTEVAKQLGISRSTLWRKMKQYAISA
ncbi:MAG TPA: sigma-54-dependent Fis family transcriptional regulator [Candidatus Hydrogenedentes bacterium]|nr:sigma-54-dependent Fis family transcriptional regulator [Candidatus Hydrogenedentota bacterium]HIJ73848.1 sigma-54-dependent Fis family transcriptional regulator [Candidatus Hydrogenedentota bacterium]